MIELSELRDAAQKAFPADKLTPARDDSWKRVAEMGWLMIELPEEHGGLGLGRDAAASIHFELGRVLASAPLAPALLGLQAIATSDRLPDKQELIERLCGGAYAPLHMLPAQVSGDVVLNGTIAGVFDADMASHVVAALPGRYVLIALDAPGVRLEERRLWDESRRLFDVVLQDFALTPDMVLADGDAAKTLHDQLSLSAHIAIASDCLGGANAILASTIEYLNTRKQFDRPLAMFQALKHRVADMKIRLAAAEALFWSRVSNPETSALEMGAMKAFATRVYSDIVEEAVQLHGGIGLTSEHHCHLYLKRATLNAVLCGDGDHWEAAMGRSLLAQHPG
jgi:alkylation response protein AidB-like acyl-CoA dehydrogenase